MRSEDEYKALSIREFTKAAEIYDSGHAGIYEMCKDDYPPILEELKRDDFEELLDVGCGTGPIIELLASEFPGRRYTGLDLTPKMIEVANAKGIKEAHFVVGDAENLPFDDASFDVVICANSFHHYPNPQAFFDGVARVLRPGGKLVLRDYTSHPLVIWLMNRTEMPLANLVGHGDVRAYTLDQVRALCTASGLVPDRLEARKKFRLHLVAHKPADPSRRHAAAGSVSQKRESFRDETSPAAACLPGMRHRLRQRVSGMRHRLRQRVSHEGCLLFLSPNS